MSHDYRRHRVPPRRRLPDDRRPAGCRRQARRGAAGRPEAPDAAGRHRQRQDVHHGQRPRPLQPSRLRGNTLTVLPAYEELALRVDFFGDEVERLLQPDPLTGEVLGEMDSVDIYPAKHFVTSQEKLEEAIGDVEAGVAERHQWVLPL